jgi:LysM repeat protein
MAPESAVPSAVVYRGSILTLVIVSIVTVFLLMRPPADKSQANLVREIPTNTPAVSATATPTPPRTATVGGGDATPGGDGTPTPTGVAQTVEPTATGPAVHVVAQGDTLSEIATQYDTTVEILQTLNPGLTADLSIGEEIVLP